MSINNILPGALKANQYSQRGSGGRKKGGTRRDHELRPTEVDSIPTSLRPRGRGRLVFVSLCSRPVLGRLRVNGLRCLHGYNERGPRF